MTLLKTKRRGDTDTRKLPPCDRCGARSYTEFTLKTGTLYFCGHHTNRYREDLRDVAVITHDTRSPERAS